MQVFYGFNVDGFLLSALAKYGSIGVDLFFVISGFVIYYSVIGKEVSPLKFAVNRAIRILPAGAVFILMSGGVTHDPIKFGLPCVAIFVGFLSLENFFKGDNFLMRLGDWSYSTYLCHVLIISFVFYVSKSYADTAFIVWLVLISMLVVALSWMSYSYIERPFVNRLKGLRSRQVVSEAA